MKTASKLILAAAVALSLGAAALAVNAHTGSHGPGCAAEFAGGPGAMGMGMGPGAGRGPGMGRGAANPAAMAEGRLAWLKGELNITASQEPAWNAFAELQRQQAEAMRSGMRSAAADKAPATAVERMEQRNLWAKQRQEQAEKTTAAFKNLYASLTPDQQTRIDQAWPGGRGR